MKIKLSPDTASDLLLYRDAYSLILSEQTDQDGYPVPADISLEQTLQLLMDEVGQSGSEAGGYVREWRESESESDFEANCGALNVLAKEILLHPGWLLESDGDGLLPRRARKRVERKIRRQLRRETRGR